MRTIKLSLYTLLIFCSILTAQTASDYFPQETGYVWRFHTTPLDSLNNPMNDLTVTSVDSFAAQGNFKGREANLILSKSGTDETINFLPYTDSLYNSFNGSIASEYFTFLSFLDSGDIADIGLLDLFNSYIDWYDVYRFNTPVNSDYQLFRLDTTVTLSGTDYPIRLEINVERLADEQIDTEIGSFSTKKFIIRTKLSLLIIISPFPPVVVPIAELPSTNWIAPGNWIVKNQRPSVAIDLSNFSGPAFFIPGSETIIKGSLTSVEENEIIITGFNLFQNYPNPFNPSTNINFTLLNDGNINLSIYDVLGRKITAVAEGYYKAGEYSLSLNGEELGISSGVYFYRLNSNGKSITKKMILSK